MVELAIAWIAAHRPVASVIAGATKPDQVKANVAAADWALGDDELAEIDTLLSAPTAGA
jgi:aryl-alcohol dehydrogenase-like predicted oxidoreductase